MSDCLSFQANHKNCGGTRQHHCSFLCIKKKQCIKGESWTFYDAFNGVFNPTSKTRAYGPVTVGSVTSSKLPKKKTFINESNEWKATLIALLKAGIKTRI